MSNAGMRTAANKANKKSYKALTPRQKKIVKLTEEQRRVYRELHGYRGFYDLVKRLPTNQVDWDSLSDLDNRIFSRLHSQEEKISNKLSIIDDSEIEKAMATFNGSQFYGGAF